MIPFTYLDAQCTEPSYIACVRYAVGQVEDA